MTAADEAGKLLEQGKDAHKGGKLAEAEKYYCDALQALGWSDSRLELASSSSSTMSRDGPRDGLETSLQLSKLLEFLGALRLERNWKSGNGQQATDDDDDEEAECSTTAESSDGKSPKGKPERALSDAARRALGLLRLSLEALPKSAASSSERASALCTAGVAAVSLGLRGAELEEAADWLREATKLSKDRYAAWFSLARACGVLKTVADRENRDEDEAALGAERVHALRETLRLRPNHPGALFRLGMAMKGRETEKEAIELFERYLKLAKEAGALDQPKNIDDKSKTAKWKVASVKHWLAVLRRETSETAPAEYVASLFDSYADRFDEHLVNTLKYQTPGLLADEIRSAAKSLSKTLGTDEEVVLKRSADLGCGTGLMGPLLKELGVEYLEGVDLSQNMLNKAVGRGYDKLVCGDLLEVFGEGSSYDLIVAADVFVYLGDLQPVVEAAAKRLSSHGLVAFSTEAPPRPGSANEEAGPMPPGGYKLARSGRYMHSAAYVRSVAEAAGLRLSSRRSVTLRYDGGKPVYGHIHILRWP